MWNWRKITVNMVVIHSGSSFIGKKRGGFFKKLTVQGCF